MLGLSLALLFTIGCGGGGGGSADEKVAIDLIVQQVLPTNGQEVLNDLSDVDGLIQVKFSETVDAKYVLDPNNAFNGLTSDVNVLDSSFSRVPGEPRIIGERSNILTFKPFGGVLPNGQYTVTVTRDVRSWAGGRLNNGKFDHRSAFTVNVDTYAPVIRNTFPTANQKDVEKDSQIIITFNESVNPATVTAGTVTVVDGGTNPPTTINGTLLTSRDDFEIVFTPDPATLLPPSSTIVVTLTGGASGITDVVGNPFEGDPATPGTYQFQFETVKEPPPPNSPPPYVINPMDPRYPDATIYFATNSSIGVIREQPYLLAGSSDLVPWGQNSPIPNSVKKVGRPGEIIVDPRLAAADLHTWLYVVERGTSSVAIISTRTSNVVFKWKQLPDPRGLAVDPLGGQLYVTNYTNDTVSFVDIGSINPGSEAADDRTKALANLRGLDETYGRQDILVGRGPTGAAHSPGVTLLYVASALDNQGYRINTSTNQVVTTFTTGTRPQDVATTGFIPLNWGYVTYVTCEGGEGDADGSVTLFWYGPSWGADHMIANLTGFKNPKGCWYDRGFNCWVANSGGNTLSEITITIQGAGLSAVILPQLASTITVGKNPTSVTGEAFWYMATGGLVQPVSLALAERGEGRIAFFDRTFTARPPFYVPMAQVHEVASYLDQ